MFIYEQPSWPEFTWQNDQLINLLAEVRMKQGLLLGRALALGFDLQTETSLNNITLDVVTSSKIEGESLDEHEVRSSISRRLGVNSGDLIESSRSVDGVVDMMLDAVVQNQKPLTTERLLGWHNSLFPTGMSGLYKINVAEFRKDSDGPMQVISGGMGNEKVHFVAPRASGLSEEIESFLAFFNEDSEIDDLIKSAIGHLWFVTIHPFEDGNGRIARALSDCLLARADKVSQRFYSMSAQIQKTRSEYYRVLEVTQGGDLDVTYWIEWFLKSLLKAIDESELTMNKVLEKHRFQNELSKVSLNERQSKMLQKLIQGFEGKLTTQKWSKMCKCSTDSALRDINDLIKKGVMLKEGAGSRSSSYLLKLK